MHSRFTSLVTKAVMTLVLVASLLVIAMAVANGPSSAASKPTVLTTSKPTSKPTVRPTVKADTASAAVATPAENAILYFAAREKGVANCSGGGGYSGPSAPAGSGCTAPGFGCMSLAQFAVYQGTDGKVKLPINSQLPGVGKVIPAPTSGSLWAGLQPGDVTYWGGKLSWYYHSGIYAGNGEVWDAVGTETVGLRSFSTLLSAPYSYDYDGAIRYASAPLLSITTAYLPTGTLYSSSKVAYSGTLHATAGTAPYRWSRIKGSLPNGLTLSSGGVISGRATKAGTFFFVVQVSDTKTSTLVQATVTRVLGIRINGTG